MIVVFPAWVYYLTYTWEAFPVETCASMWTVYCNRPHIVRISNVLPRYVTHLQSAHLNVKIYLPYVGIFMWNSSDFNQFVSYYYQCNYVHGRLSAHDWVFFIVWIHLVTYVQSSKWDYILVDMHGYVCIQPHMWIASIYVMIYIHTAHQHLYAYGWVEYWSCLHLNTGYFCVE